MQKKSIKQFKKKKLAKKANLHYLNSVFKNFMYTPPPHRSTETEEKNLLLFSFLSFSNYSQFFISQ